MTQQRLRPLDGTTVVSLEHAVAAPFCTRQLADLGARVIKVERPGSGDFARGYDQRVQGQSSHFTWINRSKQSLALDLKQDEAMQALLQLLEGADVLVQNLAPGAAARMGLSYAALRERFPRLIVCDISGYGADGPYRDKKAYDLLIQSEAGFLSVTGTPEVPSRPASRWPTSRPACMRTPTSCRPCCCAGARARAATSTCPCWRRWASGWVTPCTTPSTARRRRHAPAPRTPASIPTGRSRPVTAGR